MKVTLKQMKLTNFKSFEYKEFNFSHDTLISGKNGSGKTTIADAYNWCLYGKNSLGKTVVSEVKRRDEKCNVVHNIDYAVELVFDIDGKEKSFKRLLTEKWTKQKGCPEKILSGHDMTYYINGLQCSTKKEYDKHVNELASEDVLRIMTEIGYFFSLKDDEQKQHLIRLAYNTNNIDEANELATNEILADHQEFAEFISNLKGEKADTYLKKIKKEINVLKDEQQSIPQQISAKLEAKPADEDFAMIEAKINFKREELNKIKSISDESQKELEIAKLEKELSDKRAEVLQREQEIKEEVSKYTKSSENKIIALKTKINEMQMKIYNCETNIHVSENIINSLNEKRNELIAEWRKLKVGEIADTELVCPTCKRPFDKEELIKVKLEQNKAKGTKVKEELEAENEKLNTSKTYKDDYTNQMNNAINELNNYTMPDDCLNANIISDEKCRKLKEQQSILHNRLITLKNQESNTNKNEKADQLYNELQELMAKKGTKDVIDNITTQINELKLKQRNIANKITELENIETQSMEFIKLRDNSIADKINKLFTIVSFNFITDQLNGVDKVACNCFIEGIPYNEKNNAGKKNAGLDIINAFSSKENVTLPIFIDNAESVQYYIATDSQKILLAVQDCELQVINL